MRWPAATDPFPLLVEAASRGQALVLTPSPAPRRAAGRAAAARPASPQPCLRPVGRRPPAAPPSSAAAPRPGRRRRTSLRWSSSTAHDERFQDERAPTWHARDVAVERAAASRRALRAGVAVPVVGDARRSARCWRRHGPTSGPVGRRSSWSTAGGTTRRTGLYSPALVEPGAQRRRRSCAVLNRAGRAEAAGLQPLRRARPLRALRGGRWSSGRPAR